MFVKSKENENEVTEAVAVAGTDEPTTEQTELEPDATVDTDTDGLTEENDDDEPDENETDENETDATTFSRKYVEKLRRENAGYRERANRADELAARLHTALVAATGRMADATDLPFDAAHLDDEDAMNAAIDELLAKKPHLAARRPFGDIGQGNRGAASEAPVNLADILRARA